MLFCCPLFCASISMGWMGRAHSPCDSLRLLFCRYKFAAWHPDVLSRLPRDVVEAFPALIFPQTAVDRRLVTRMEQSLTSKTGGFLTLASKIEEAHKAELFTRELRWDGLNTTNRFFSR